MGNKLTFIQDSDNGDEWIYVNGEQVKSGQPIYAQSWLNVIQAYGVFSNVESFELTYQFGERVDWDYNKVPQNLNDFQQGDLE